PMGKSSMGMPPVSARLSQSRDADHTVSPPPASAPTRATSEHLVSPCAGARGGPAPPRRSEGPYPRDITAFDADAVGQTSTPDDARLTAARTRGPTPRGARSTLAGRSAPSHAS